MAHELDTTRTGAAAFISRVQTAWHRLGKVFSNEEMDALTTEQALELAGLDFQVQKAPNFTRIQMGEDGRTMEIPTGDESFSIVRTDRWEVIGTVGANYQPLQNAEAFRPVARLIENGHAQLETAGSLRGGRQVWGLVRFDLENIVRTAYGQQELDAGQLERFADEVRPYGLFTNDHTGSARARMQETAVRVVCANTYAMAMGDQGATHVAVTHSGDVEGNYQAAANMMLNAIALRYAGAAAAAQVMKSRRVTVEEFQENVLDVAAPVAHLETRIRRAGPKDNIRMTEVALDKAHDKRNRIQTLWTEGDGHQGDQSAWEAFQGFVQWVDHEADARDHGASLLNGHLAQQKDTVATRLAALSGWVA